MNDHVLFLLAGLWRASWQASALAGVVLLIQRLLGQRLGGRGRYALWMIVLIRLLLPVLPESRFSVFNLAERWHRQNQPAVVDRQPQIASPVAERSGPTFIIVGEDHAATVLPTISPPTSTPTRIIPPSSHWSLLRWIAIAWLVGAAIIAMQVILACWKLSRQMRAVPICADPDLLQTLRAGGEKLHLRHLPRVRVSDAFRTPAIVGVIRPALLLPKAVLSSCNPQEIRLIVLHELAHLKRRDVPATWLIAFATILHWFNPIVWLAAARMRSDRELACDELVLSHSTEPDERNAYGQTLVKLIEVLALPPLLKPSRQMIGMVGILEQTRPMQRRVRMIARFNPTRYSHRIWTYGILVLLASIALTDAVRGDAKKQRPSSASPATRPATRPAQPMAPLVIDGTQTDADLKAKLQQSIGDVAADHSSLGEVIGKIQAQSNANINVHWAALEAAGIDKTAQVDLHLKNISLKQALDLVLADVGGQSVKLGYQIMDGAIVVSTEEELHQYTVTVAYDISDLISSATTKPSDEAQSIEQAIEDTIDPDSWKDKGGTVGTFEQLNGKLIVQNTPNVQDQIEDFFKMLRQQPKAQPAANADVAGAAMFGPGMESAQPGQAMFPSQPHTVVADAEMDAAIATARAKLNQKLPEVKFDGNPLSDVIDFYREVTGANIVVNWSMLKPLKIEPNSTCTLQLKDATLEECLEATFKQFDFGSAVAIVVDRNVLTITSQMDIPSYLVTKTYHVKDLVGEKNAGANLIAVVQNLIQDQPGGGGNVQLFADNLVVTTPLTSQDQVAKLLDSLRSGASTQPTADSWQHVLDQSKETISK